MVKLILIDYGDIEEDSFELFDDIEKAFNFCLLLKKEKTKINRIDLIEANKENIYYENEILNYEDNSYLIKKGILSNIY